MTLKTFVLTDRSIKPLNYNLSIYNLQYGGDWKYDGLVKIASKVQKETDEIVINVKDVKIVKAEVHGSSDCKTWMPNLDGPCY